MSLWDWFRGGTVVAPEGSVAAAPVPATEMSADALTRLPGALRAVAPGLSSTDPATWVDALTPAMRAREITTARRAAMFLGQCAHESAGFRQLAEDLNYHAAGICRTWPSRFPTLDAANPYEMRPAALANCAYANRMGNGDEATGDGWRFRGGGLIQLTGRQRYSEFAAAIGKALDEAAAWVRTVPGAAASAAWYWQRCRLNDPADAWDIREVTFRINGGLNGISDRTALCNTALRAFGA